MILVVFFFVISTKCLENDMAAHAGGRGRVLANVGAVAGGAAVGCGDLGGEALFLGDPAEPVGETEPARGMGSRLAMVDVRVLPTTERGSALCEWQSISGEK